MEGIMPKPTYEEAEKLIGKRTPLPVPNGTKSEVKRLQAQQEEYMNYNKKGTIGSLVANPVMNPGAIARDRVEKAEDGMKKGGVVRSKYNTVKRNTVNTVKRNKY